MANGTNLRDQSSLGGSRMAVVPLLGIVETWFMQSSRSRSSDTRGQREGGYQRGSIVIRPSATMAGQHGRVNPV
jgi:hypothetical protein